MKQNDPIEKLFDSLKGEMDIEITPLGHQDRFLERLSGQAPSKTSSVRKLSWWRPLSIAASILLLLTAGIYFQSENNEKQGLAAVSEEMEETQSFFVTAINEELETLKSFESIEAKTLVEDTMKQLLVLEEEYENLKVDLTESGNDKRVIAAMIANFQSRIDLLQHVIETIENIEKLKANNNETTI